MKLSFEISGLESLDKDFEDLTGRVNSAMAAAMPGVASVMENKLREQITRDVYAKWMPSVYERRRDNPQLGTSLIDKSVIDAVPDGDSARLTYEPVGDQYQWDNPLDGDALIERIETGRGYEWPVNPGKRPFWDNFVKELIDNGAAAKALVDGMNAADRELGVTLEGNDAVRDPED